jgi:peptidoglycan-associated lipoprotein
MKIVTKISLAVVPAMFLLLVGGCSTTTEQAEEAPAAEVPPSPEPEAAAAEGADAGAAQAMEPAEEPAPVDPFEDPNNLLSKRTVYFEFDSSVINDDATAVISAHAQHMVANGNAMMTIEGHCDERGTREYNIALGERRADAVRRVLIANGVSSRQINVVSYGEERPAAMGHDESAWSQNRRGELMYTRR